MEIKDFNTKIDEIYTASQDQTLWIKDDLTTKRKWNGFARFMARLLIIIGVDLYKHIKAHRVAHAIFKFTEQNIQHLDAASCEKLKSVVTRLSAKTKHKYAEVLHLIEKGIDGILYSKEGGKEESTQNHVGGPPPPPPPPPARSSQPAAKKPIGPNPFVAAIEAFNRNNLNSPAAASSSQSSGNAANPTDMGSIAAACAAARMGLRPVQRTQSAPAFPNSNKIDFRANLRRVSQDSRPAPSSRSVSESVLGVEGSQRLDHIRNVVNSGSDSESSDSEDWSDSDNA